jgi:hypothetical protein
VDEDTNLERDFDILFVGEGPLDGLEILLEADECTSEPD